MLLDAGLRIGEALGLRHEDLAIAERQLTVRPRVNDNRAWAKGDRVRTVSVSGTDPAVCRLPHRGVRRVGQRLRLRQSVG